jgi:hypothetical protein
MQANMVVQLSVVSSQLSVKAYGAQIQCHPPDFVIPSEAWDLQFADKMQIPRFARDDNSLEMLRVVTIPPRRLDC